MKRVAPIIRFFGFALLIGGCQTAREAAVNSWRVIDAPANYVRRQIEGEPPGVVTTTTTTRRRSTTAVVDSDVVNPGRPINLPPPNDSRPTQRRSLQVEPDATPHATPKPSTAAIGKPSSSPRSSPSAQQASFPTAKPVPERPGYVYSLDGSGGLVDVTGYKSGDKVKDPYSGKIFLVP